MSFNSFGDQLKAKAQEVKPAFSEVAIFKQLIKERAHPLDLIRELLSNAGAEQVGATNIEIAYTRDRDGHVFEVSDDGCGMTYTGNTEMPGRLDRFLGLGLSGIVGHQADEFSWKGLGSKLAYHSRRVEIETCAGAPHAMYDVRVNVPWETLQNNNVPHPRVAEHPSQPRGTRIRVFGHPPHQQGQAFSFEEIRAYLTHRTFAGFTRQRQHEPRISLSVLGQTEEIPFGFPEFRAIDFSRFDGLKLDEQSKTLFIDVQPKSVKSMTVKLKGFITWSPEAYELKDRNLNTGLILSVKGIPYFTLNMAEYGSKTIRTARPGEERTCLVVECDAIQDEMNISRSGLVDSPKTLELKRLVSEMFEQIESSEVYLLFRRIPEREKFEAQGSSLVEQKRLLERAEQTWVVLERPQHQPLVLMREPQNETEVNALIFKLEVLGALPFAQFQTLAYIGASRGPDLLVNFQEDKVSEPSRATVVEVENNFYNYKTHGHLPAQYPKVLCWDVPTSGRKAKIAKTDKSYKFTVVADEYMVQVFALKYMEGVRVMSREELTKRGVKI